MSFAVRAKLVVANYGLYLSMSLLLLSAVALGAAVSVWTNPPVQSVSEEVDVAEYAVSTDTTAVVNGPNVTLFERGDRVRNLPVYYYEETPTLTIINNVSVPEGREVTVDLRLTLVLRATRGESIFFEREVPVSADRQRTTDGLATFRSSVNMLEIRERVQRRRAGLRGVGSLQSELQMLVTYEGEQYAGSFNQTSPFVVGESAFWLDGELSASRTHSQTVTQRIAQPPEYGRIALYAALGLGLMVLGGGLAWRYLQGFDVERLRTALARSEFSDWISRGEMPTREDKEYVAVDSLEDVVDIGIDSNKRVIYDRSIDAYAVVDADVVYYFTHADENIGEWLDV